jgi:outer membrane receptor protein involved in Fe transport
MSPSLLLLLWMQAAPVPAPAVPPPSFADTVVVTASRGEQRLVDAVSSTTAVSREELARSPALTLDDQLRQVPGFSLLRRSSSLTAHPTSQGVSLRGLGPSGASRTLVLFDGTPLNDPFGGWVYWDRLPVSALQSVEVARGSLSQLYGSAALGGAIQLLPRAPQPGTFEATVRGGDHATRDAEVFASDAASGGGPWGWTLAGRYFDTDGFFVLSPEDRGNGTGLQHNETSLQTLDAGYGGERWQWDLYGQAQRFQSTFSRILPNRSQEFLTAAQDFRTRGFGGSAAWRSGGGLLVGADLRRASWDDQDQTLGGLYAQDTVGVTPRLDLLLGARFDLWQSQRTRSSFNPRVGALFRATDAVTLRASAYRGFRAPTLNELYRPFRVGNVETQANPSLGEESLLGAELGADYFPEYVPGSRLFVRVNAFHNRLDGAIGNVTLSVTPQLITRRRENLDRVTVDGLESEIRFRLSDRWQVQGSYLYSDSRVERTGLRVPQVPLNQGSAGVTWSGPVLVLLQGRWAGAQFEDDLNQLPLASFVVADLALRRPFGGRFDLFLSIENLFDEKVVTGRTPLETLGAPRLVQLGVTVRR